MPRDVFMQVTAVAGLVAMLVWAGDHGHPHQAGPFSDPASDGHASYDPVTDKFSTAIAAEPRRGSHDLDEEAEDAPEYRAFLSFSPGGADGVSANASTHRVRLEIFIDSTGFTSTIPSLPDLVPYPIEGPTSADYDSPPLDYQPLLAVASDTDIFIDLGMAREMRRTCANDLVAFQVRLLVDPTATEGSVEVADVEEGHAPLLTVSYY